MYKNRTRAVRITPTKIITMATPAAPPVLMKKKNNWKKMIKFMIFMIQCVCVLIREKYMIDNRIILNTIYILDNFAFVYM